jgi:hypothetical protein
LSTGGLVSTTSWGRGPNNESGGSGNRASSITASNHGHGTCCCW